MKARLAASVVILTVGFAIGSLRAPVQAGPPQADIVSPPVVATRTGAILVQRQRVYRLGPFLVVDALVRNSSPDPVDAIEVLVEFYNYFDELLSFEHSVPTPPILGPGHSAAFRVATPNDDAIRKIRYRFTWWSKGEQLQNRPEHEPPVWR